MTGAPRQERPGERGLALIAVLWISALLAVIATALATGARQDLRLARNLALEAEAAARADGALQLVGGALLLQRAEAPEAAQALLTDPWLQGLRIEAHDAAGRIDLNSAPEELLLGLLLALEPDRGLAETLLARILDWRDEDDQARPRGAEADDYARAGLPQRPANRPFERIEELARVMEVTPALYARLAPHLTLHSAEDAIDPWEATETVIRALPDINAAAAEIFLADRRREAGVPPDQRRAWLDSRHTTESPRQVYELSLQVVEGPGAGFRRDATLRLTDDPQRPLLLHRWERGGR